MATLKLNILSKPIDQSWTIERIAKETPAKTWEHVYKEAEDELRDVSNILIEQENLYGQFYPLKKDTFAAFNYTPLNNTKLVVIGQDPYHQMISIGGIAVPRAVGLSFSVRREDSIPSSLNNIYTELVNTVRGFVKPNHGDLREWCAQGVLLLNTCLTVRPNQPGSHGQIWLGFMYKIFRAIEAVNPNCIYMLWGKEAQKLEPMLGDKSIILKAAHPSGYSASRGFFGCNHFNLANDHLIKQGKPAINWKISSLEELRGNLNTVNPIPISNNKTLLTPINSQLIPTTTQSSNLPVLLGNTKPSANVMMVQSNLHKLNTVPLVDVNPIPKPSPVIEKEPEPEPKKEAPIIPKIQFGSTQPPAFTFDTTIQALPIILPSKPVFTAPEIELPNIMPLIL